MISVFLACSMALPTVPVAVDGEGYLRFSREGRLVYAKSATLTTSGGFLASDTGAPIAPSLSVPGQPMKLEVDLEGRVRATYRDGAKEIGRLVLAVFDGPAPTPGPGGFLVSTGKARLVNPGEGATGVIRMSAQPTQRTSSTKSTPSIPTRIEVHATSEVTGRQFTLGEIAVIEGSDALAPIVMGESPALGVERGIDKTRIVSRLKMAGVDPTKIDIRVPANAKVLRKGQKIENERFIEVALEAAKTVAPEATWVPTSNLGTMTAPEGELELVAERTTRNGAQVAVTVGVLVDGRRFNSRTLMLVAGPGAKALKAGAAVRIRVIANGAVVEVAGRTKAPATVGSSVEVTTNASPQMASTTLTGKLVSESLVEVRL